MYTISRLPDVSYLEHFVVVVLFFEFQEMYSLNKTQIMAAFDGIRLILRNDIIFKFECPGRIRLTSYMINVYVAFLMFVS